ncbi:hypothetical protein HFO98_20635 [Rhizobium leguminosarum]|uniref:hypothetical protein n=1 Tax=Rhizobium leguminosarum TaxID=384 RepID=UPI001C94574F|nr:hypothetical protein [Rhizobium leguminosarum]MBY5410828.1 hypothetical protein [Rhizobium leguminosarum]
MHGIAGTALFLMSPRNCDDTSGILKSSRSANRMIGNSRPRVASSIMVSRSYFQSHFRDDMPVSIVPSRQVAVNFHPAFPCLAYSFDLAHAGEDSAASGLEQQEKKIAWGPLISVEGPVSITQKSLFPKLQGDLTFCS